MKQSHAEKLTSLEHSASMSAPDVFEYLDFRKFLQDYYRFRKEEDRTFSHTRLSRKMGVCKSYLGMVMSGNRNISEDKASQIAAGCGLTGWESDYFLTLVQWNQSTDERVKKTFWEKLVKLAPRENNHFIEGIENKIVSKWFTLALIEMIGLRDFQFDPQWISDRLMGRVSAQEVSETIGMLVTLGVVQIENGTLKTTKRTLIADRRHVPVEVIKEYHRQSIPLAISAMDSVESALRDISSVTAIVPMDRIQDVKTKIVEVRTELLEYINSLEGQDEVYELNIQFFPVTRKSSGTDGI